MWTRWLAVKILRGPMAHGVDYSMFHLDKSDQITNI